MTATINLPTPAQAYWNQRHLLSEQRTHILALSQAVNRALDLRSDQWAQLMAFVLEFAPDVILELGRGLGNSTCVFTQAAHWLLPHQCRVLSLDISDRWDKVTVPSLRRIVPDAWFQPLQALRTDILTFDYRTALADFHKVLIFWDAHGYDIAECVLGGILPEIATRAHLIVMHDLSDARYLPPSFDQYGANGLWKKNTLEGPRLRINNIYSAVEQAVAILDFTTRNKLPLNSADHSFHTEFDSDSSKKTEMQTLLGEQLFSVHGDWFWFSLHQGNGTYTFPQYRPPNPPEQSQVPQKNRRIALQTRLKIAVKVLLNRYPVERLLS